MILQTPTGERIVGAGRGEAVTITGEPQELLLFVAGRDAVRLEFDGDAPSRGRGARGASRPLTAPQQVSQGLLQVRTTEAVVCL